MFIPHLKISSSATAHIIRLQGMFRVGCYKIKPSLHIPNMLEDDIKRKETRLYTANNFSYSMCYNTTCLKIT